MKTLIRHGGICALSGAVAVGAVSACGGGGGRSSGGNPDGGLQVVGEPAPIVSSVAVDGTEAAQVRQGFGTAAPFTPATVRVIGKFLDNTTGVTVGKLPATVTDSSDTSLTFTLVVPHGALLGGQTIFISTSHGVNTYPNGLTITPITSDPDGTDKGNTGTDVSPYRSLAKALSVAGSGDTVFLKNGTYDQAHGDSFAVTAAAGGAIAPNVPAGVNVKGESAAGTKLVGTQTAKCADRPAQHGLVLAGDSQVSGLDLSRFCSAVDARAGTVAMDSISAHDNESDGIILEGTTSVTVSNSHIFGNAGSGITSSSNGSVTMTDTEIDHGDTFSFAVKISGTSARVSLNRVQIHDQTEGIALFDSPTGSSQVLISGTVIRGIVGNGIDGTGVSVETGWSMTIRGSTFVDMDTIFEIGGQPALLDLGTVASPGKNVFNIVQDGIEDDRTARTSGSVPITVFGNTWTGADPPPQGCSASSGPAGSPHSWHIANYGACPSTGNVIIN